MNIGDKVVCIDDWFAPEIAQLYTALPVEGQTYVVRAIHSGRHLDDGQPRDCIVILLVGLVNPSPELAGGKERGFKSERFRKLDELQSETKTHLCKSAPICG